MRRQNSSCDQCRKGKRACDAGAVRDLQLCLDAELQCEVDWQGLTGPCSNCRKTRKSCTFDWARSQQMQIRERRQSTASEIPPPPSRKRIKSTPAAVSPGTIPEINEGFECSYPSLCSDATNVFNDGSWNLPTYPTPTIELRTGSFTLSPSNETVSNDSFTEDISFAFRDSASMSLPSCISDEAPRLDELDSTFTHVPSSTDFAPEYAVEVSAKGRKRPWRRKTVQAFSMQGISEFSPSQQMVNRTNNGLMTDNLMKLYHDVMEGALSCWLTEQNCPYLVPSQTTENLGASVSSSNSTNRIYGRVLKLDRSLGSLGIKPLTPYDDRKAARALHFSIMAFTAQWAQGSQRSQSRYEPPTDEPFDPCSSVFAEDFDMTLQKSFWNQARRLLDDCAEVNSFKVAFAELIFGLTQKYTSDSEDSELNSEGHGAKISERVRRIFEKDHNVYVERSARRLHVLRRRSEGFERRRTDHDGQLMRQGTNGAANSEERTTIELIFWLAIMFDTLSAAITERPVTVSDEESKEINEKEGTNEGFKPECSKPTEHWNDRVIIRRYQRLEPLRWPCPEEAVSRELRDAAPVKVLLFRKITRLQTLSSRRCSQGAIENAIEDAVSVYRHWNMTYGPLFQDCIQHHNSLPSKVQSWYVCLLGHWLLAVMILADNISLVDEIGLGMPTQATERAAGNLVAQLRRTATRMVSDLARASTPQDGNLGILCEFHQAVNEGAVLTEPWTMVLIRSFTMAGIMLLGEASNSDATLLRANGPVGDLLTRSEDCVKALWYLGRKSILSRQVAGILGDGLRRERSRMLLLGGYLSGARESSLFGQVEVL